MPCVPAPDGQASMPPDCTLVLGLGNVLLKDDGAGVWAVRLFQRHAPNGAVGIEVGTNLLGAIEWIARATRIVAFDAMIAGLPPGTVSTATLDEVLNLGVRGSLHELGLPQTIHLVRPDKPPVTVVAVEPAVIDYGLDLSPAVAAALPAMVARARSLLLPSSDSP